jgi:hypothetical protein
MIYESRRTNNRLHLNGGCVSSDINMRLWSGLDSRRGRSTDYFWLISAKADVMQAIQNTVREMGTELYRGCRKGYISSDVIGLQLSRHSGVKG